MKYIKHTFKLFCELFLLIQKLLRLLLVLYYIFKLEQLFAEWFFML